jgi:hypothetical protein
MRAIRNEDRKEGHQRLSRINETKIAHDNNNIGFDSQTQSFTVSNARTLTLSLKAKRNQHIGVIQNKEFDIR